MPSEKRQRQDEGRLQRLEAERHAATRVQRKRQLRGLVLLLVGLLAVAGVISLLSGDDGDSTDTTDTTAADGTEAVEIPLPPAGASITGATPCPAADGSSERTTTFAEAPPICIDPTKAYTATLTTSEGDITIDLDVANAPVAVNNFVVLARYHFYDGVAFHRIVPGFVNQTGDPVGPNPGEGGPGYSIPDELPDDPTTAYPAGAVAMANAGANTAGSQFFLVVGDESGALSGSGAYTVFGQIAEGEDVSSTINTFGNANEEPTKLVTIGSVTITES